MIPRPCGLAGCAGSPASRAPRSRSSAARGRVAAAELGRPAGHEPSGVEEACAATRGPSRRKVGARLASAGAAPPAAGRFASSQRDAARRGTPLRRRRSAVARKRRYSGIRSAPTSGDRSEGQWISSSAQTRSCCARQCAGSSPSRPPSRRTSAAQLEIRAGTTDDVWRGLADLGVTGLLVPEAAWRRGHGDGRPWPWCSRSSGGPYTRGRSSRRQSAR